LQGPTRAVVGVLAAVTGATPAVIATAKGDPVLGAATALCVALVWSWVGGYQVWRSADRELQTLRRSEAHAFRHFAQQFAGWFKGRELEAPADLSHILDEKYQAESQAKLLAQQISYAAYERSVAPLKERDAWEKRTRAEYQQEWRAEAIRHFEWAVAAKVPGVDPLGRLIIESPSSTEDVRDLAQSFTRGAERLGP
jgi:hypothetical protein